MHVNLGSFAGEYDGIGIINGAPIPSNGTGRPSAVIAGKRHEVYIRIRRAGSKAAVAVELDGKLHIEWSGDISSLSVFDLWKLPQGTPAALGIYDTVATFHSLELITSN